MYFVLNIWAWFEPNTGRNIFSPLPRKLGVLTNECGFWEHFKHFSLGLLNLEHLLMITFRTSITFKFNNLFGPTMLHDLASTYSYISETGQNQQLINLCSEVACKESKSYFINWTQVRSWRQDRQLSSKKF